MLFCLGDKNDTQKGAGYQQNYCVFNQKVDKDEWNKIRNSIGTIKLPLEIWIDKKDMISDEKDKVSGWSEMGGYLKHLDYEEAWQQWWNKASEDEKNKILGIKYFDAKIFTEITGIKDFKSKSLRGKEVEVKLDGQTYKAIIQ
jgi:hypothetical protein